MKNKNPAYPVRPEDDLEIIRALDLRAKGRCAEAAEIVEPFTVIYPEVFGVWMSLAAIYSELENWPGCERAYANATRLGPRSEMASVGYFHTLVHLNRSDEAFDEMRRLLTLRESPEYTLLLDELLEGVPEDEADGEP